MGGFKKSRPGRKHHIYGRGEVPETCAERSEMKAYTLRVKIDVVRL